MSALFVICFAVLLVYGEAGRIERAMGDQPPPGKCCTFKDGGFTNLHQYACCNNCNEDPNTCDKMTYDSASFFEYCGTCGQDEGDGTLVAIYGCGGCEGQEVANDECLSGIRLIYHFPGLCWAFINCFEEKCKAQEGVAEMEMPATCFNLKCEEGEGEDEHNCPIDCCQNVNPMCIPTEGECLPRCCSESTCCADECIGDDCSVCEIKNCESWDFKPMHCPVVGDITSVTLAKQISVTECTASTYSYSGNVLTVDDGCRGDFYVCYKPCPYQKEMIECESWEFEPSSCTASGDIHEVSVVEMYSTSQCQPGSSYTFNANLLTVTDGCRAKFLVCYISEGDK